jgi:hypothetical protein
LNLHRALIVISLHGCTDSSVFTRYAPLVLHPLHGPRASSGCWKGRAKRSLLGLARRRGKRCRVQRGDHAGLQRMAMALRAPAAARRLASCTHQERLVLRAQAEAAPLLAPCAPTGIHRAAAFLHSHATSFGTDPSSLLSQIAPTTTCQGSRGAEVSSLARLQTGARGRKEQIGRQRFQQRRLQLLSHERSYESRPA